MSWSKERFHYIRAYLEDDDVNCCRNIYYKLKRTGQSKERLNKLAKMYCEPCDACGKNCRSCYRPKNCMRKGKGSRYINMNYIGNG